MVQVLFVDFPRAVVEMMFSAHACSARGEFSSDCILRIGRDIASGIQNLFARSLTYLTRVISLVQFFAAWAILAWLIGDLVTPTSTSRATKGIKHLVNEMSQATRLRFGLGTIIAVGAYLCFCAIVAVSLFKPVEKPQVLDQKELEDSLKASRVTDTSDTKSFSSRFPDDLASLPTGEGADKSAPMYPQLLEAWRHLRTQVVAEQDRLVQRAVASYKIENLNRVGSREQANHFLALNKWFQTALGRLFAQLDNCRAAILQYRLAATRTADINPGIPKIIGAEDLSKRSGTSDPSPAGIGGVSASLRSMPWFDANTAGWNALRTCQPRELDPGTRAGSTSDPPDRSDFGYTLGVVGDLSIWLLRTESMPLALITGLIGFGLFGALVSTFVRVPAGQTTQLDIFGVVWRGVSAAIVVFLAAYSGIAIVSQNSGDPNPYVVFVTCLVGAVFGDDVWLWAKRKFLPKEDGSHGTSSTAASSGAKSPVNASSN